MRSDPPAYESAVVPLLLTDTLAAKGPTYNQFVTGLHGQSCLELWSIASGFAIPALTKIFVARTFVA
jgi:hypothetical protein